MRLKYCPNCAGMSFKKGADGAEKCAKCNYSGAMKYDSVDVINSMKRRVSGAGSAPIFKKRSPELEPIDDFAEKEESELKSTGDSGFSARLPERKQGQGNSSSGTKEKFKPKSTDDWEII
ncbi:MAG: hypothetical protein WC602_02535 [archaeon]